MEQFILENIWLIIVAAAWTLPWKGVALWRAARNGSVPWFVALLLINTLGVLEILYIFILAHKTSSACSKDTK